MNLSLPRSYQSIKANFRPTLVLGIIIIVALAFFEMFNYSTTEFALKDLLGDLRFMGIQWATLLSIAFCGIDFAGIARLFTPEQGDEEHKEVWYLFGAWLLAATMNAALTWWGVSMAIANHNLESVSVVAPKTIQTIIPVFVAIMVWIIRILIIGTISAAGDRFIWGQKSRTNSRPMTRNSTFTNSPVSSTSANTSTSRPMAATAYNRPNNNSSLYAASREASQSSRGEPTYHSLSMSDASDSDNSSTVSASRKF